MTTTDGRRLPTAAEEARFWSMLETAWAPLGDEVNEARRALSAREPGTDADVTPIERAFDEMLENLARDCHHLSDVELVDLDRVVERKLHDIDRADVHAVTDGSDDGFLYARGFIVGMGHDFYHSVLRDPRMAIEDAEGGMLCYFFARLHSDRHNEGTYPATGSGISREGGNLAGWPG
ncbi:DUF4240 domain-containing protein [Micromonospora sp. NPDC050397]|uniref:DUF4240 domain-containing protein n=1 Tax=Micromonospora sp. NPDC050397 TaxID=3364279 RepID=UPI00384FF41E